MERCIRITWLLSIVFVYYPLFSEQTGVPLHRQKEEKIKTDFLKAFDIKKFALISSGEFVMGCVAGDAECEPSEKSPRLIKIIKPFYLGKYEVTQSQWFTVMRSNWSDFKSCGDTCPVNNVSWNDTQVFLKQLNLTMKELGKDGLIFRLPTEAEWEYAAKAGSNTKFFWGDEIDGHYLWYSINSGYKIHPVGQKKPNLFGLYDINGNVSEWTEDILQYQKQNQYIRMHVIRGCSWFSKSQSCRSSNRNASIPTARSGMVGFRLVLELQQNMALSHSFP
ncbi:formylglycine-generating enzyme family protein [Leptospira interrogans serovar Szwajizak]|uniref:formylglycine-generating enzyme family protein n=1 Tax=Leptospira interrogans TaxID=173 RepID=UPI00034AF2E9